ncbi:MAG: DUF1850 domain-containing protein [Paracoccus denitrificans]|uniref:DUF1850 domain-containing protein n=1 Tax=Paracoccus denitrificans TaxID=266 RepID=A0A533I1C7_PARDE|nr:MAG: DUF1850 domain-containing protein [Paracoccus denitrificans]
MAARSDLRAWGVAALAAILPPVLAQPVAAGEGAALCLSETRGDGAALARLPLGPDGGFELSFIHSVSRTPVRDVYRVEAGEIIQTHEIFTAHGAGLPSVADDVGVTAWRHKDGRFVLDMRRPTGPIHLRVQAQYENTLHIAGTDLALADLGVPALTLAPCDKEPTL